MKINEAEVTLNCKAQKRDEVLKQAAFELARRGCVDIGFSKALLDRERETSTWLGSGIAMPHIHRRDSYRVKKSSFHILQYPDGVVWEKGRIAFLVVVVAALDNEHLDMLAGLAGLFSDERLAHRLSVAPSREAFVTLLNDAG